MEFVNCGGFDEWRSTARWLLAKEIAPQEVQWNSNSSQLSLFETESLDDRRVETPPARVPQAFLEIARNVACHRDKVRWPLLYRSLWRIVHGEPFLLKMSTDDDVHRMNQMQKAVTRDVHKMKAFVRFRKVQGEDGQENFVAWHRPDHSIVRLVAPFFARRFRGMNWTIMTPDESAIWDQHQLSYGDGVSANGSLEGDALEELWKTYYASIFNPARVNVAMMKREMPVRHWPTLPEALIIDELLMEAPERVKTMLQNNEGFDETAQHYMPSHVDLDSLRDAAECCKACHLYEHATQTVFGEGSAKARIVLVGEQPGDSEDLAGKPFVGPAGKLLRKVMVQAGVAIDEVYMTNVVKHFKFTETSTPRGKHRLHKKPDAREIFACRPWLEAELRTIKPERLVCLGATAAQALLGRDFRITASRGKLIPSEWCRNTIATWHPSAILRMPDPARRQQMQDEMVADLLLACAD